MPTDHVASPPGIALVLRNSAFDLSGGPSLSVGGDVRVSKSSKIETKFDFIFVSLVGSESETRCGLNTRLVMNRNASSETKVVQH